MTKRNKGYRGTSRMNDNERAFRSVTHTRRRLTAPLALKSAGCMPWWLLMSRQSRAACGEGANGGIASVAPQKQCQTYATWDGL